MNTALFPALANPPQDLSVNLTLLPLRSQSILAEQYSARPSKELQGGKRHRPALQELVIQLNTGSLQGPGKLRGPTFSAGEGLGRLLGDLDVKLGPPPIVKEE